MRYRVKDYQIALPGGNVQKIGLTGLSGITIEDIRLIVNETKNKIICSSMKKANVTVADTVGGFSAIDVPQSVCILSTTDILTIEIDKGDVPERSASQLSVDLIQQRLGISGEVIETLQAALQGNDTSATLAALKTLVAAIPTSQISGYALQGTDPTATNTKILEEIATASSQVNLIEITSAQITAMINRIIIN